MEEKTAESRSAFQASVEGSNYSTSFINEKNWHAFKDFYLSLSDALNSKHYFAERNTDDPQTWIDYLKNIGLAGYEMFGLWDNDKLIGYISISNKKRDNKPILEVDTIQISDAYLDKRLAIHLCNAVKDHLQSINFQGNIECYIEPHRTASFRTAFGNGFVDSNKRLEDGRHILIPGEALQTLMSLDWQPGQS